MSPIIGYVRVSTKRQGESGLGLDAQRSAIAGFARSCGREVIDWYVEVESGKRCDRPELSRALVSCRKHGATLAVAKLDRLARDLAFVAGLMKDGVDFIACDSPCANKLTIQILSAVAEDEGRRISERVRMALAQAKAKGTRLGGFQARRRDGTERSPLEATRAAREVAQRQARTRAVKLLPMIREARTAGCGTLQAVADWMNNRGVVAPRGGVWHAATVLRALRVSGAAVGGAGRRGMK